MNDKIERLKDFKIDIYEALHTIYNTPDGNVERHFGDVQVLIHDRLVDGSTMRNRHLSERNKMRWHSPKMIYFSGSKIALAQVKPHGKILVYNVTPAKRMARNILLKTLHSSFPNVKIIYE